MFLVNLWMIDMCLCVYKRRLRDSDRGWEGGGLQDISQAG